MSSKMTASRKLRRFGNLLSESFFDYDTPKMVQIKSWKAGAVNRIVQLLIILYAFGYVIIWEKGYQSSDKVLGSATSKLKGTTYTNFSGNDDIAVDDITPYTRIWDVTDYVIPAQSNGFFVMTNMVLTGNQKRGVCPEDLEFNCTKDTDCLPSRRNGKENGKFTGNCVPSDKEKDTNTCEVLAWCPTELDRKPLSTTAVLGAAENFTVYIKNAITFPKFNFSKKNTEKFGSDEVPYSCRFNNSHKHSKYCPIFQLGTLVEEAGMKFSDLAYKGGVVIINIDWQCNLDHDDAACQPKYSFILPDSEDGFNFRYSKFYRKDGVEYRDLTKAYGILFQIEIFGEAGKFDIVPLMLNIASGVALLSLATVMCDVVVLYFLKKRRYYKECKYQNVSVDNSEVYDVSDVTGAMKLTNSGLLSAHYMKPNSVVTIKQTGNGKTQSRSSLVSGP